MWVMYFFFFLCLCFSFFFLLVSNSVVQVRFHLKLRNCSCEERVRLPFFKLLKSLWSVIGCVSPLPEFHNLGRQLLSPPELNSWDLMSFMASSLRLITLLCVTVTYAESFFSEDVCDGVFPSYSKFEQFVTDFWSYDKPSSSWRRINFTTIIQRSTGDGIQVEEELTEFHAYRGRVSLLKFSDSSMWITGHSGSLYEKFWNGVQWAIIPHDLPTSASYATGVYSVNRTMLALSEEGKLYQLQLDTSGQLHWANTGPWSDDPEPNSILLKRSPVLSSDENTLFFTTKDGWLAELSSVHPVSWKNHGQPRGGDVAHVVDAGSLRESVVFTISSDGDLYEYDVNTRPAWKKHIRTGSPVETFELAPATGVCVHELGGTRSFSLFLMTKNHFLVERRLAQGKWRWLLHPKPTSRLSFSLGPVVTKERAKQRNVSLFLVSQHGSIYEYKLPAPGNLRSSSSTMNGTWIYHSRPDTAVMPSVPGVAMNADSLYFMLQDGRLGQLHTAGFGGAYASPLARPTSTRKQQTGGYVWSVHEAPESEGGNADYCTVALGPMNCLEGAELHGSGYVGAYTTSFSDTPSQVGTGTSQPWSGTASELFRARTLQFGKSIFLVGSDGIPSERFHNGNVWLWLKHEFTVPIRGILGVYNGSVFMNDLEGTLLTREWNGNNLQWLNCTALEGGSKVTSGSPWDGLLGEARTVTLEDAQFFVSESGNLLEFTVAMREFAWKDRGHPPDTAVAAIVDQEVLRYRVVYVIGLDGKMYHFNRITETWHGYNQPSELILSRIPGAVHRPSFQSTAGSLFMRSETGSMVELLWDVTHGWVWIDHGFPSDTSHLATSPGPCMENGNVLVVGSDGRVYARQLVDGKWRWEDFGHPLYDSQTESRSSGKKVFVVEEKSNMGESELFLSFEGECDTLIDSIRPVALSKDVSAFLLRDGRLAELKQEEDKWEWVSIIDTPTSSCHSSYWTSHL